MMNFALKMANFVPAHARGFRLADAGIVIIVVVVIVIVVIVIVVIVVIVIVVVIVAVVSAGAEVPGPRRDDQRHLRV